MIKYRMNLVKTMRIAEKRHMKHKAWATLMILAAFAILAVGGLFAFTRITEMQRTLDVERAKLKRVEDEYRNYQSTQTSIDKADIELLNQIQTNRVYWTKKLEAMARHLPEEDPISYWITRFGYQGNTYTVSGFGYITERQEQLLALDEYLSKLRNDPNYTDVFGSTSLRSAIRSDETERGVTRERVSFEYASTRRGGR
jgi:Tfp pilus assembly protein PilN